jgi:hypothetical protein
MYFLIDTNVAVVANKKSTAGARCVDAAVERLERLKNNEILVLDDAFHILNEYDRNLNSLGKPGLGDIFYLWVLRNRHNPRYCEQVTLTLDDESNFAAYPKADELAEFDPSDRKFVAVALTHPANPPIVNAKDKDWYEHYEALTANGIIIEFICPEEMARPRNG